MTWVSACVPDLCRHFPRFFHRSHGHGLQLRATLFLVERRRKIRRRSTHRRVGQLLFRPDDSLLLPSTQLTLRAVRLQHVLPLRVPVHRLEHELPFDRAQHDLEGEQQQDRYQSKLDSEK